MLTPPQGLLKRELAVLTRVAHLKVETVPVGQGDERSCGGEVKRVGKVTDASKKLEVNVLCPEHFFS
jgi:hypothetical protein